ncbi:MAG: PepSY-associated TM helix domain-containing protein [Acidobacteriota bacterium]|nr:PepSY-associated TM helix domain-containing protein [Acidobacteriota bacterium]
MHSKSWIAGYWARPRGTWFRAAVFQVHLWAGLIIGLYALAIGLSGSALVFHEEIRRALEPGVYCAPEGPRQAALEPLVQAAARQHPGYTVGGLDGLDEPGVAYMLWLNPANPASKVPGINLYFNPHTGALLGERGSYQGVLGWFANLHYFLLLGQTGAVINGALAIVLLLMCLTGIAIWWPGRKNWRRGFRVSLRGNWKLVNWNLHSNGGFLLSAVLLAFCLTGIYFEFPRQVAGAVAKLSGMSMAQMTVMTVPSHSAKSNHARISYDEALAIGRRALPPDAVPAYLIAPTGEDGAYALWARHEGPALFAGQIVIHIDQYSGQVLKNLDSRTQPWGLRLIVMSYAIHFGTWGGMATRVLWLLAGLAPGGLFVSGFLMWWNRVVRRKLRAWKKNAALLTANSAAQ